MEDDGCFLFQFQEKINGHMNTKLPYHFIVFFPLISICFSGLDFSASQDSVATNNLPVHGDSLFARGDYQAAREAYRAVLKIDKNSINAYIGLGKIAIAEEKWADAGDEFQKVLDRDPDNKEAHYYCGISARETGKFKALLLRKLDWEKSKKHFHCVMMRDSLYRDVIYQYAILLRYRKDYMNAIKMVHTQIRLRPDLVEPWIKLFRFYRYLITHTNPEKVLNWLKQQSWEEAKYVIGEKYRREDDLLTADSVLSELLPKSIIMPKQPIYLSLARIYYAKNQAEQAESYYWRAVAEIKNNIEADLVFEDVKYIVTDQELHTYHSLNSMGQKMIFFRKFWARRDPTPAASINYRLAEHYKRLVYAEKYYEYDGFRTWFNNPDKLGYLEFTQAFAINEEFNDKGLIYIRHGKPDEWAATVSESASNNESWLYFETQTTPRMTFHFLIDDNSATFWRFTPIIANPEILEDRLTWDSIYYRLLRASDLERSLIINEMASMSRESVNAGLSTDRHTWEKKIKPLEIPFSTATFRGQKGKTILEIYYAFSLAPVADELTNKVQLLEIEKGLSIHSQDWEPIDKKQEKVSLPVNKSEYFIDIYRVEVPPDSYHVAFYLRPLHSDFLGGWKYDERIADYSRPELSISDIELATKIEPATKSGKFEKKGLSVIPNPTRLFSRKTPVYIYFEIYNLYHPSDGNTSFKIEYTITLLESKRKWLLGLLGGRGGKSSITTQIDREGKTEFSVEYLAIDVTRLKVGEYNLKVKVTDRNTNKTAVQSRPIALE